VKPFSPHLPHPKQRTFLELDAQEVLYGGAAGGGKSDALLMAALQYVDRPNYSALLLRRREVDLFKNDAIGDRALKWFEGTSAVWDAGLLGWRFPSGATISFGHLAHINDRDKWKGPAYQFIGVEELTEWDEGDYVFLFSRLRSTDVSIPTRMRSNTNPGGIGHAWVRSRFVAFAKQVGTGAAYDDWRTGERAGGAVFESPPSSQVLDIARSLGVEAQGAHFVPAFADDNPSLDRAGYLMNLAQLDPVEYAWFAKGDWNATPSGKVFKREWFGKFLDEEPPGVIWCRYWDLAGTDPELEENLGKDPAWSAGCKVGLWFDEAGAVRVVVSHLVRDRKEPGDVELLVHATAQTDGRGIPVVFEREPGSSGKAVIRGYALRTLKGYDVHDHHKTGSKEEMWRPLAGVARNGGLYLVRGPWNSDFVNELVGLPRGYKDQADACAGGYAWLLEEHGQGPAVVAAVDVEVTRESPWEP
jgi:phage terminase large subunit-like protein